MVVADETQRRRPCAVGRNAGGVMAARFAKCYNCKDMVNANSLVTVSAYVNGGQPSLEVEVCQTCWSDLTAPSPHCDSFRRVFDYIVTLLKMRRRNG